jgi:tryptophan synthase alpha chain
MNRVDAAFARLRADGRAGLIPFLTVGDPDMHASLELMRAAEEGGADLLELGVPFSDPTADGPVLQRSAEIGLRAGASLPRVLELVSEFRRESMLPIILYGYYNPIFRFGPERFATAARQAGADALLVVDLPPEEAAELLAWTRPAGLHVIFLLAPTSGQDRVRAVLRHAAGFIYYVSVTGVTGVRSVQADIVRPAIERLRGYTRLPLGVGFGISTPEQVGAIASFADAAVVGSAIMRIVDLHRGTPRLVTEVATFIRHLKSGMLGASATVP